VTTQILETSFGKFSSFQRAHVVKEKKSGKSKGYGFVSFMNADDYTKAFQEFNSSYFVAAK
jgi:RNA recognition motif-containing protein